MEKKESIECNEETGTLMAVEKWREEDVLWTDGSELSRSNEIYKPKEGSIAANGRGCSG